MNLSKCQHKVLNFIISRWESGESLPSCREICTHLGYASPKAATDHLKSLKKKGYLEKNPESSRGYRLTHKAIGLPVLGEIPAGIPSQVTENIEFHMPVNTQSLGIYDRSKAFMLRVHGDSMTGRQIFNGDLVLIEQSANYKHEDIVVALIDNESTLKTLIQDKGQYWLRSENPKYSDIVPAWDLQIQGIARSVIRLLKP